MCVRLWALKPMLRSAKSFSGPPEPSTGLEGRLDGAVAAGRGHDGPVDDEPGGAQKGRVLRLGTFPPPIVNMMMTEDWHKSSHSNGTGGDCVEARAIGQGAAVRDTQNRDLGKLDFVAKEWVALQSCLRAG